MTQLIQKKNTLRYVIAMMFSAGIDIAQIIILPLDIPGPADIVDIIGTAGLTILIGPVALFSLIELIPGATFIPSYTIITALAWKRANNMR